MENVLKQEQPITAISLLPFPKETIKQEIMKLAKNNSADTENRARIRMYYLMLSTCISDDDAKHVNDMEKFLGKITFPMSEENKKKFIGTDATSSDIDRYMKIMATISVERNQLIKEIDAVLK